MRLQNEELQVLATTDPLTGVANRRSFSNPPSPRYGTRAGARTPLSFVMCDIDYFKRITTTTVRGRRRMIARSPSW